VRINQVLRTKGSDVATVQAAATVRDALALLATRGVGALVVSPDGVAVEGILSERDVARGLHEHGPALLDRPVSAVMTSPVHTCVPTADIRELAQTMTDNRVRHVPVVADGRMVGIVSIGDVVKARLDELEAERAALVDYIQT
jgi:CBS domain-containing protein